MGNSKKEIADRINRFRQQNDLTIQQLSDRVGMPKGTVEKYLQKPSYPNVEFVLAFTSTFGVSKDWLLEGTEPIWSAERESAKVQTNGDYVEIRRFNVDASAGHGSAVALQEETGQYAFKKAWLDRRGLNSNNLSVISVAGDSMEPDLHDGDLILIDHATTTLADSSIYAVRFSDALYVKRIQHLPGDKVHLISSNRNYPPIEIAHPVADGVEVVGRVVASMHEW